MSGTKGMKWLTSQSYQEREKAFWQNVEMLSEEQCWKWKGAVHSGYGQTNFRFSDGTQMRFAHRIAFKLSYGGIPRDLFVCHKCDAILERESG